MPSDYLWLIPLLPFSGFLINGTLGRRFPRALVTAVALLCTAIPAVIVAWLWATMKAAGAPDVIKVVSQPWIAVTGLHIDFAFTVDHLTLIMLGVVTGVGFLIHLYSVGYMAHEDGYWRFFAYLNLFMFFMSILVLSSNFLLLFVGWEGVGLASYLLIGFYFRKDSAANAGKKAFIVNRIGDFGFLLAMFLIVQHFGSLDFNHVFSAISANPDWHGGVLTAIALLLVLGAAGKSAQIPLYVWLPDAMEGPTPVSALIHAATMVTAGIYMVARCHTLFDRSPYALGVVAIIGAATAILAASIAFVQHDIKRVLAYSTVSQLGYMFLACGVGAYAAGIFHLMTHAFFKALLFLAAGSVIHALSGEQDMRKMGGLSKKIKWTYLTMLTATLAIAGFPPLAGFFSKDSILLSAYQFDNGGKILYGVGLFTALLTSFYMFRLIFLTFFGKERYDEHHVHVHESPNNMLVPLMILAVLSLVGGWLAAPAFWGGTDYFTKFLEPVFAAGATEAASAEAAAHALEIPLAVVAVITATIGLFVAWWLYLKKPEKPAELAKSMKGAYSTLLNKYYVDELYAAVVVKPLLSLSSHVLWQTVDVQMIDGAVNGIAHGASEVGDGVRHAQSGNTRSYAVWVVIGAIVVIAIIFWPYLRPTAIGMVR